MPLRIGALELGAIPRIAAIVDRPLPPASLHALTRKGADFFELRVDCWKTGYDESIAYTESIRRKTKAPLLCTIRETAGNRLHRLALFRALLPSVDAVDIELDAPINREVISLAKARGRTVIVSEHDFKSTPSNASLRSIVRKSMALGADIVKIAATPANRNDLRRLLCFCAGCGCPIVAIAMGEIGAISRIAAPVFGSMFTYAYVTRAVAPGQLPLVTLTEEMDFFFPERRRPK
jgi:3-dehydroquinate dehydratase-1